MDRPVHQPSITCKYCNSNHIVKYGTFHGMQRYYCKDCLRKFADNDALPGMKTPVWVISLALNSYFEGMPLSAIQKEINLKHGAYYAKSSIYNWIVRFSTAAVRQTGNLQAPVSDRWLLVVTPATAITQPYRFLDMFDIDSEFLISSQLSETGSEAETVGFLETTHTSTRKTLNHPVTLFLPDDIFADFSAGETAGSGIARPYWVVKADKHRIEEYGKLLKKRNTLVRTVKNINRVKTLTAAWQLHYNFLSENSASRLAHRYTSVPFKNWADIINLTVR